MKLQYLGTGAAEGMPAIFCDCVTCRTARERGGRNIRTRSQAIVDGVLLIDFPADTYYHFLTYGVPLTKIHSCLITHSHMDHLYAKEALMRLSQFSHLDDRTPLTFFSDASGCQKLDAENAPYVKEDAIRTRQIPLCTPFEVEGYTVTALRAQHDPKSDPVVYLIEKDGRTLFYSNDTGGYPEESWAYLASLQKPIDLVSFDCTFGNKDTDDHGHMTVSRCIAARERLQKIGAVSDTTVYVLNHFSHNGEVMLYEELSELVAKDGFVVSYDGMEIEV